MTEERTPYIGENDPPAPTAMARLVAAVARHMQEEFLVAETRVALGAPQKAPRINGLVRAVLAELKAIADESPCCAITVEAIVAILGEEP